MNNFVLSLRESSFALVSQNILFYRNMSSEYLSRLNRLYNEWIGRWKASEILHVKIDGLDFQHNDADFAQIRDAIANRLLFMKSR